MARIGVFGGTFDPVHVAHVVAAATTRHELSLDRVLMVVANQPWQKEGTRQITAAEDRFEMVCAALGDVDGIEASRLDIDRGGPSYTADTLAELVADGGTELFLIVGDDVGRELHTWQRVEEVADLATIVLVGRPGSEKVELPPPWRVVRVEIPRLDISSSDLRARAEDGRPLDGLVPPGAVHWIQRRGLYARGR